VTEDDWYEGYFIPKNTIIMMNIWAMHYDPEYFPEPEKVHILSHFINCSLFFCLSLPLLLNPK